MTTDPTPTSPWGARALSVLRIVAAFLFMAHGTQKLIGFPTAEPRAAVQHLLSMVGVGGILETFGGLLLLLGLLTRPVAFLLCGEMAVAYFRSHAPRGFWPILNRGEVAVLYCFVWGYLSVVGGGAWSLDAWIRKRGGRGDGGNRGDRGDGGDRGDSLVK